MTGTQEFQKYVSLVIAVVFPICATIFLFRNKDNLDEERFEMMYGPLYKNLKTFKRSSKFNLLWLTFFLLKRLILVIITVTLRQHGWVQIAIF